MAQTDEKLAKRLKATAQRQRQRKVASQKAQGKEFKTTDHSPGVIPEPVWQGMKDATPKLKTQGRGGKK